MKLPFSPNSPDIIVDDEDKGHVSFSPLAWMVSHDLGLYASFNDQSYHYTYSPGASVTFSFTGTYVAFYADLNSDHGAFLASIDDGPGLMGTSYAPTWSGSPRLLFSAHMSPGPHTLTITNAANPTTRLAVGVDFFVYRSAGGQPSTAPTIYTGEGPEPSKYTPFIPAKHLPCSSTAFAPPAPASGLPVHAIGPLAGTLRGTCAVPALIVLVFALFVSCVVTIVMLARARRQVCQMELLFDMPPMYKSSPDLEGPPHYVCVPQSPI